MGEPLENLYFNWLCAKVVNTRNKNPSTSHWQILKLLHQTEFVWLIDGDDNRIADGKELRTEFLFQADIPDDPEWRTFIGCSILELLIAFSRRAAFMSDIPDKDWFWEFIDNLGLTGFTDDFDIHPIDVEEILDNFIWRTYEPSGHGGLLPLDEPFSDQRGNEIWHQLCDYIADKDRLP